MPQGNLAKILGGPWTPPEPDPPDVQLRRAMEMEDLVPPSNILLDGNIHRFSTNGDPRDDSGWYVAYADNVPAGRFGDWRTGLDVPWRSKLDRQLSAAEHMTYNIRIAEAAKKRDEEKRRLHEVAEDVISEIWSNAGAASDEHPYLKAKGIKANGARITGDGRLIVPLYNDAFQISSLQYIDSTGDKKYHSGGLTKGCFHILGDIERTEKIYIAEGFATAATVYEETGRATVVAYSTGNLVNVTGAIKKINPNVPIVIVADNDKSGVGKNHAEQAAAKHGASFILPPDIGDVNDFRISGGNVWDLLEKTEHSIYDRLKVITGKDILESEYKPPDEIVQGMFCSRNIVVLYGASNSGKTFWSVSMAAAISEGKDFHGKIVDGGPVVYLATEAPDSVKERMAAYKKYFGSELSRFYMVAVPVNFYRDGAGSNLVIELCSQIEKDTGMSVRLVIGDTLARVASGANENSGEDMGPVMDRLDEIATATSAAVMLIHHSGKDQARGARGWSGIQAHVDTEFEIMQKGDSFCSKITKDRSLGSKGDEFYFKLDQVYMGLGKFGDRRTTCVSVPDEETQKLAKDKRTEKEKDDIATLRAAWETAGMRELEGVPYISRSALREFFETHEKKSYSAAHKHANIKEGRYTAGRLFAGYKRQYIEEKLDGYILKDQGLAKIWMEERVQKLQK